MSQRLFGASHVIKFVASTMGALIAGSALAAPVVIDFNDMSGSVQTSNFTTKGIVFSPGCHYDIEPYAQSLSYPHVIDGDGMWMGFDASGCGSPTNSNQDYLGPSDKSYGALFVAPESGKVMNLMSFTFGTFALSPNDVMGFSLSSSKGGSRFISFNADDPLAPFTFNGPEWTNLDWLIFSNPGGGPTGFDNLTLNLHPIDEPGSIALFVASAMGFMRWRPRRAQK
jgi:hypothetical protein